jgi:hypothetical protein
LTGVCEGDAGVFTREVEQLVKELERENPVIEEFRAKVRDGLPVWKRDEERRGMEQRQFANFLKEMKKKATHGRK